MPYHEYMVEDALSLARSIIHGPLPPADAPTPTVDEAIEAISGSLRTCGFNWITGQTAIAVLKASKNVTKTAEMKQEARQSMRPRGRRKR